MKIAFLVVVIIIFIVLLGVVVIPGSYISSERSFEEVTMEGDGFQLHGLQSLAEKGENWIVLVHGNRAQGQEHDLYTAMRELLPDNYSILVVDLRGFGGSVGEGEQQLPASIDRMADLEAVGAYLSGNFAVEKKQVVLIGHSYGAAQVFNTARENGYLLVLPMGLGDWDALVASDSGIDDYIQKFEANTGIQVPREVLVEEANDFTTESLFADCPASPVWLLYGSQEDAIPVQKEAFTVLAEKCGDMIHWSEVPISDHMYGTEMFKLPQPLRGIYSRLSLSLLKFRLGQILGSAMQQS
jgi:alpha/beta superfamily hydrolase